MASVVFWTLAIVPVVWMYFDRDAPVRIDRIELADPNVARGQTLQLTYDLFRYRLCDGEIQRFIVDSKSTLHFLEPYGFSGVPNDEQDEAPNPLQQLGQSRLPVLIYVPDGAAPGTARYQAIVQYRCNRFQKIGVFEPIIVKTRVVEFEINDSILNPTTEQPRRVPGAIPNNGIGIPEVFPVPRPRSDLGPLYIPASDGRSLDLLGPYSRR